MLSETVAGRHEPGKGHHAVTTQGDPVEVVEAGYRLDLPDREWLEAMAGSLASILPEDSGTVAATYSVREGEVDYGLPPAFTGDPAFLDALLSMADDVREVNVRHQLATSNHFMVMSQEAPNVRGAYAPTMSRNFAPLGICDMSAFICRVDWTRGVLFSGLSTRPIEHPRRNHPRFGRLAAHVSSAHRLRLALAERASGPDAPTAEAVFAPDGRLVECVEGRAPERSARDVLREHVRRVDRARSRRLTPDRDAALALWEGLVGGTWSLVDSFDTDGRRYVVAHRNPHAFADVRGLTRREREVTHLVTFGYANAEVAYALGIQESAVATHLSRVFRKTGAARREDLVRCVRGGLAAFAVTLSDDASVSVLRVETPDLPDAAAAALTPAEKDVARRLLAGHRRGDVARDRGTSYATVAKQAAAAFRKLGVQSQAELLARFGVPSGHESAARREA